MANTWLRNHQRQRDKKRELHIHVLQSQSPQSELEQNKGQRGGGRNAVKSSQRPTEKRSSLILLYYSSKLNTSIVIVTLQANIGFSFLPLDKKPSQTILMTYYSLSSLSLFSMLLVWSNAHQFKRMIVTSFSKYIVVANFSFLSKAGVSRLFSTRIIL